MMAWNKGLALILPGARYGNMSDRNVYVEADGMPQFAMGWPKWWSDKRSLARWRSHEDQDRNSITVKAPMDERIREALARGEVGIDWAAFAPFQAIATGSNTLPVVVTLPGKSSSDKAGSR